RYCGAHAREQKSGNGGHRGRQGHTAGRCRRVRALWGKISGLQPRVALEARTTGIADAAAPAVEFGLLAAVPSRCRPSEPACASELRHVINIWNQATLSIAEP